MMIRSSRNDDAFTLIEILVAMALFAVLTTAAMAAVLSTNRAVVATRSFTSMNEQARIAFERITREMRQAEQITAVVLPSSATDPTSLTFTDDFNSNGLIDLTAVDPEILTYRYDPADDQVTLTANDTDGTAITRPILSDNVTRFDLQFRSSLWQFDKNGDGVTTWQELDASPSIGNGNGVLDAPELAKIDSVVIELTITDGGHAQTYQTQVGLRNNALS